MTATADPADVPPKKRSKLPLILGLVLAIAGAGGGFMAVRLGLLGGGGTTHESAPETATDAHAAPAVAPVSYVALDPLIVNMPRSTGRQFLRFAASLEVVEGQAAAVEAVKPRIADVMNSYLRAVEPEDFEDQMILTLIRSQLLRRIQVVTGEGRVRDLLVTEFVLN